MGELIKGRFGGGGDKGGEKPKGNIPDVDVPAEEAGSNTVDQIGETERFTHIDSAHAKELFTAVHGGYKEHLYVKAMQLIKDYTDDQIVNMIMKSQKNDWLTKPSFFAALYNAGKDRGLLFGGFGGGLSG